jgi:hypothetical protein
MTSFRCQALVNDNGSTSQCQNLGVFQVHSLDGAIFGRSGVVYETLQVRA